MRSRAARSRTPATVHRPPADRRPDPLLGQTDTSPRRACPTVCGEHTVPRRQGRITRPQSIIGEDTGDAPLSFGGGQDCSAIHRPAVPRDMAPGHALRHPCAQHGLVHHAGVDILQPMIPPPQRLLQKPDLRTGQRRNADRHAPRVRSGPCAAPSGARANAGWHWYNHRSSRRPHRPDTGSHRSPRTPSRASSIRLAIGAASKAR